MNISYHNMSLRTNYILMPLSSAPLHLTEVFGARLAPNTFMVILSITLEASNRCAHRRVYNLSRCPANEADFSCGPKVHLASSWCVLQIVMFAEFARLAHALLEWPRTPKNVPAMPPGLAAVMDPKC